MYGDQATLTYHQSSQVLWQFEREFCSPSDSVDELPPDWAEVFRLQMLALKSADGLP